MSWLDHKQLFIAQGVGVVPGDNNSVENPLQVLNLMDTAAGISLKQDGWSPSIPALESGGIWADSPLSSGRNPLVMQDGNVTETMQLNVTASSFLGVTKILAAINTMAINSRAFWTDNAQYDPIYLAWWASCGAGMQYALVYNMDLKYEYGDGQNPIIEATLTIEREPYWRWLPPGANPKQWYYEWLARPNDFNAANSLIYTPALASGALNNRSEFSRSGAIYSLISDNALVIPGSSIPGDAPALLFMFETSSQNQIIVGKKTAKITQYNELTPPHITMPQNLIFNATDGVLGTDATKVADTGACKNNVTGTAQRVEISFATATNQLRWNIFAVEASINRFIGRFMVFMRCRQQGGTLGDITMYLRYAPTVTLDTDGTKLNIVNPPVIAGAGNTTNWGLVYMGVITSPQMVGKANVNKGGMTGVGNGLQANDTNTFDLGLFALRSAGAAPLYINDVILIPIDEGSFTIDLVGTLSDDVYYDETGYFTHGSPDIFSLFGSPGSAGTQPSQMTGTGIQLTPGVENRLYCISYNGATKQSQISDTLNVYIQIVPRSRGIRDRGNING